MVNLLQINGAPFYRIFNSQMSGSELCLAELNMYSRNQLVSFAVRENFKQVILIDPILDQSLNVLVSDLIGAAIKCFVVSNQGLAKRAENHEEKAKEDTLIYLTGYLLLDNSICSTPSRSLSELLTALKAKPEFRPTRSLVISRFSMLAVLAGLELLGYPNKPDRSEAKQSKVSGEFKDYTSPLNRLKLLIDSLSVNQLALKGKIDRSEEFQAILEELLIN